MNKSPSPRGALSHQRPWMTYTPLRNVFRRADGRPGFLPLSARLMTLAPIFCAWRGVKGVLMFFEILNLRPVRPDFTVSR